MKSWLRVFVGVSLATSTMATANIALTDDNTTSFDIAGEILPECKVTNQSSNQATQLNLASPDPQAATDVAIWCNTGQETANTTYSSANQGFLVNEQGNRIAYNLSLENSNGEFNLATAQTIQQRAGEGVDANGETQTLLIQPQVSGFETAGNYRDTVQITVSYN
jgi:spore coat protein U-like protein